MSAQPDPTRVLLVEDDPEDAILTRKVLAEVGQPSYAVETVADAGDAVAALTENRHDVALVDLRLGARSGSDVIREAHARGTRVPMIVLTGESAVAADAEALGAGAADFLVKGEITPALIERAIRYAIATARRVDERLRAEEARRESEALFRAVIQASADIVTILDGEATILYESPAVERLLGYRPEELIGRNAFELVHPDDLARVQAVFAREAAQRSGEASWEYRFRHHDGSWRHLETTGGSLDADSRGDQFVLISRDVTERKQLEERLHRQLAILRGVTEGTTDAVYVKDAELRYVFINSAGAAFLRRRPEDVVGCRDEELFTAESVAQIVEGNRRALAGETVATEERIAAGGETRTYSAVEGPLRDSEGHVVGVIGISRDITAQRAAERELRERNELLQTVLDNIPAMVTIFSGGGELLFVNATWSATVGYSLAETQELGTGVVLERMYPDPEYRQHVAGFIAEAAGEWAEFRARLRDGRVLDTTWANVRLSDGRSLGIGVDVSARKEGERRLREAMQALEHAVEGIARLDAAGRFETVNGAFAAALGTSADDLLGRDWSTPVHPDDLEVATAAFDRAVREGRGEAQVRGLRPDGRVFHQAITFVRVRDDAGDPGTTYCFVKDVSEQHRLEGQLLQSQKVEAVGSLAGGIAHDFNNMLAVINGYSEMLLGGMAPDSRLRGYVSEIHKAGTRAADLTRQLLAFSRKQLLEPRVLDLNQSLRDIDKMLRRLIGEDVELVTLLDPDLGRVKADPGQLEQVIVNLAVNARDAMPQGGKLVLRTRTTTEDEIRVGAPVPPGSYVALDVEDTGTGMTPEILERIFDPFFTTKPQGRGTGLGLPTVYGIVKQSGGFLDVKSRPGEGSVFRVYLPQVFEAASAPDALSLPALPTGTETVLMVEDEPMVRTMVQRVLKRCGYTVLEAGNGEEALRVAEAHQGPIHLLLTDVVMPRMSGRELAERLAVVRPDTQVLFMTGYADDAVMRHGLETATVEVLQKPFTHLALAQRLRRVLDRAARRRPRGSVLLVDDDPAQREALAELLRLEHFEVATASDGREALETLRGGLRPDAIVLDLFMPGMNGWVFRIEQRNDPALAGIPVILMSGEQDPAGAAEFLQPAGWLPKPVDAGALVALLDGLRA